MKYWCWIVLLLTAWSANGQIRVSSPVQNLGDVFESSGKVVAKFELTNPYREDTIRIVDITTSCGCTAVLMQDTLILPQSTIILDVAYDPDGRLGLFVKSVELTTRTGKDEYNKLFLKIEGNVVAENYSVRNTDKELVNYEVAPIYFFPITSYDTSYLDFNYIGAFVNDLTFEVDFYQFATVGIEVDVAEYADLEALEHLLKWSRKKLRKEFKKRGFDDKMLFFEEPVFKKSGDVPNWAAGIIRLFSVNFDAEELTESAIEVSSTASIKQAKLLLNYQRFALPEIEEILAEVNFESIESKLFLSGELTLKGTILMPWKKGKKIREQTAKDLQKAIQKKIKETTGATKKDVHIAFDSLGVHPDDKYLFLLWDEADKDKGEKLVYREKKEAIVPPLLPTYKQSYINGGKVDTTSLNFIHFWGNLVRNAKAGYKVEMVMESSLFAHKDQIASQKQKSADMAYEIIQFLTNKFLNETGDSLGISLKNLVHGPSFDITGMDRNINTAEYAYFNLIPIVHHHPDTRVEGAKPYMVNFDYFFKGINTGAWGFQQFAEYISAMVRKQGYIALRIESSISKIPVEKNITNQFLAYQRLLESEKRLKRAMGNKLVDPNRILFTDESVVVQGPEYDGSIPVLKFREYHYIRIIPENLLSNN